MQEVTAEEASFLNSGAAAVQPPAPTAPVAKIEKKRKEGQGPLQCF